MSSGEHHLDTLLATMKPALQDGLFFFLTSREPFSKEVQENAIMVFREAEGMTVIVREDAAKALGKDDQPKWAMITLTVHSDLAAVGFLAVITTALAKEGISVNPVSAFYHDHLFVPAEKSTATMDALRTLTTQ